MKRVYDAQQACTDIETLNTHLQVDQYPINKLIHVSIWSSPFGRVPQMMSCKTWHCSMSNMCGGRRCSTHFWAGLCSRRMHTFGEALAPGEGGVGAAGLLPPAMERGGSSRDEEQLATQLKLFASYSPAEVVLRYLFDKNPVPPAAPEQDNFEAAIGFVDVSGFTALSEKLNKDHGRKGAELLNQYARSPKPPRRPQPHCAPAGLKPARCHQQSSASGSDDCSGRRSSDGGGDKRSRHVVNRPAVALVLPRRYINAYFKELIDGVFLHHGDVIKFAGDAMQVVWRNRRDQNETLAQLILRASACCLDLLKRLNNFEPVAGVVLKLHMGVGAGMPYPPHFRTKRRTTNTYHQPAHTTHPPATVQQGQALTAFLSSVAPQSKRNSKDSTRHR